MHEMTESDYLNSSTIIRDCDNRTAAINKVNDIIPDSIANIQAFMASSELDGDGYESMKTQMSNYILLLQSLQYANELDLNDLEVLASTVGSELLDGHVILTEIDQYGRAYENESSMAASFYSAARALPEPLSSVCESIANHFSALAENDKAILDEAKRKKALFEQIYSDTENLFTSSQDIRSDVKAGLSELLELYNGDSMSYSAAAGSWHSNLTSLVKEDSNYQMEQALKSEGLWNPDFSSMSQSEIYEYMSKAVPIIRKFLPNIEVGQEVEIIVGIGMVLSLAISGTANGSGYVTSSHTVGEEMDLLGDISFSTDSDGKVVFSAGIDDLKAATEGFADGNSGTIPFSPTVEVSINDKYSVGFNYTDSIESTTFSEYVTENEDIGNITTTIGLTQYKGSSGYETVPVYDDSAYEMYQSLENSRQPLHTVSPEDINWNLSEDFDEGGIIEVLETLGMISILFAEYGMEYSIP